MSEAEDQFRYRLWWFAEWLKGGKTGAQIDQEVREGELTPKYPPDWPEQTEPPPPRPVEEK